MFNSNDYEHNKAYRQEMLRKAAHSRLVKEAFAGKEKRGNLQILAQAHARTIMIALLVIITLSALLVPAFS